MNDTQHAMTSSRWQGWRLWVIVVLVLLAAAFFAWESWRLSIRAQLRKLRDDGYPTTLTELNDYYRIPPGVPDATQAWLTATRSATAAGLTSNHPGLALLDNDIFLQTGSGATDAQLHDARDLLTRMQPTLKLLRQAADENGMIRFPTPSSARLDDQIFPRELQEQRSLSRFLQLEAHLAALDGEPEQAAQAVETMYRQAKALQPGTVLISQLIGIAAFTAGCETTCELLSRAHWTDDQLQSLQQMIAEFQFREGMKPILCGERAYMLASLETEKRGPLTAFDQSAILKIFEEELAISSGTWQEIMSRQERVANKIFRELNGPGWSWMYAKDIHHLPGFAQSWSRACGRAEAKQRCLFLLLAAQRYRMKTGQLPGSLAELEAAFPELRTEIPDALVDPFDGLPMRFRADPDEIRIYAIGEDFRDDGGALVMGPTGGRDIGYSLKSVSPESESSGR